MTREKINNTMTTIRAPLSWLDAVGKWASAHGISRNAAIIVLVDVALKNDRESAEKYIPTLDRFDDYR